MVSCGMDKMNGAKLHEQLSSSITAQISQGMHCFITIPVPPTPSGKKNVGQDSQ
jgi:hypothetical protein